MKWLKRFSDYAYALLRIVAGAMFAFHGVQKVLGILAASQPPVGSQLWFGGIIELLGGLAVMLGFKTRWAAFLCSGTMAVAYFQFHWKLQLGPQFFPAINHGELAALYSFVFLYIACRGGVRWRVDKTD
jgi:putative oxidoreductase